MKIEFRRRKTSISQRLGDCYGLTPEDEEDQKFLDTLHNSLTLNWREHHSKKS